MNFILISPAFPHNFKPFAYQLKKKGVNVLGVGDTPYSELGHQLQETLTEYYYVRDLEQVDDVKRAVAYLYFKYGKIDRIESHNEYWLELEAELREEFNVFGAKPEEIKKTKFKSEMKKLLKKAGVPVAEGRVIHTKAELEPVLKELGLPVVAKPDNGVGSAATFRIETPEDIEVFLNYYDESIPYFIEEMISSNRLGSYDGLIDQDGNIVWHTCLTYKEPTLSFIENKSDVAYVIQRDIDPKLVEYGQNIVKEFGMKERFFHIEFFRMPDGDYIALEYNNRIAGNYAVDMYNFSEGIDLFAEYANIVLGQPFQGNPDFSKQYSVGFTQRDQYDYKHRRSDILAHYGDRVKQVERMPEAFQELMGNDFYAIVANTQDEVDEIIDFAHRRKQ